MIESNNSRQISKDEVYGMLQFIPADERDIWVKVGMALKSEYGEHGFELFDRWSQSSQKYQSSSVISAWKSFK